MKKRSLGICMDLPGKAKQNHFCECTSNRNRRDQVRKEWLEGEKMGRNDCVRWTSGG